MSAVEPAPEFDIQAEFEQSIDLKAMQTFLKAMGILGGPRELFDHQRLTWLPSLIESIYAVILDEETDISHTEIANELGISEPTVSNILNADAEAVRTQIQEGKAGTQVQHVAGGLAKLAYREIET
ncbi:MAG: hypothetical protein ABEI06_10810 [Halobacteriaceae archaeon]